MAAPAAPAPSAAPAPPGAPLEASLRSILPLILVAGLGYMVDVFDMLLLSIVRVPALTSLGITGDEVLKVGTHLLNLQLGGALIGGIAWGMLGDKRGRLSVLFGSILLYSAATLANGYVHTVEAFGILRFIAGFGLAGELGAGLTLIVEEMPIRSRGAATATVAAMGVSGAVFAGLAGEFIGWRGCFILGGAMGFVLLLLRLGVHESGMFRVAKQSSHERGNLWRLFDDADRFLRWIRSVLIGIPIWFSVGILVTFSPEMARALGVTEPVIPGRMVMFHYAATTLGDVASGLLSQRLRSRKKAAALFIGITAAGALAYLLGLAHSAMGFYWLSAWMGVGTGYWAVTNTMAVEQFGTDLRATVGTSVPNLIRGAAVPMTLAFVALKGSLGAVGSALAVGAVAFALSAWALWTQPETYGKDLDYRELA
ncbi:MAG: MFS transporter [Gemmatimonadetes bacterium]|nr:MFS transporter [Gemmatimonadota bacterium]